MDETSKYIKMCEGALPDIGCHGWQDGDFAYRNGKVEVFHQKAAANMGWQTGDQCIPLYRQDQLQELIADKIGKIDAIGIAWNLHRFCGDNRTGYAGQFLSMEQLWLAFVMKELHGKVWDDEKEEWR